MASSEVGSIAVNTASAMPERPTAVLVQGLVKRCGSLEAVRGIDFQVTGGEIFGFLGPNGAGKSTTIKILCTLAQPTGGSAEVAGYDVVSARELVRRNIGLVFQDPTLDSYLTAEQNLRFHQTRRETPSFRAGRDRRILSCIPPY
nr:ATP-binding cassette domain-containing protein [Ferrimicrobium acidiphilum]